MKIVRLKRGYRINLSDSEFAALDHLVLLGMADIEGISEWDEKCLSPQIKRGLNGSFSSWGAMGLTEDRRK